MNQPYTDNDICRELQCNKSSIVKYRDLTEYKNLDDLFKNNKFIVLLLEAEIMSGHWTILIKKEPSLYYYINSYGKKPDRDVKLIIRGLEEILGNTKDSISLLFEKSNSPKLEYNKIKWQNDNSLICGRYVVYAKRCIVDKGLLLKEYQDELELLKKEYKTYDNGILKNT